MIENIASEPINTPITKPRRVKNARSTSGAPARDSTVSSSTSAAAASASGATTASGAVVTCGSACSVNTSDIIKVASRMKPIQSVRWSCAACAPAVAAPAEAMPAMAVSISGTSSQKISRQPVAWVMRPPTSGPMLKPSIRKPAHAAIAPARRSGAALRSTAASVLGTRSAAARPCKARPASSMASDPAIAMRHEAAPNSAMPTIAASFGPNRPATWPPSTTKPAETTR
jgi:hypothetical protein